VSLAAFTGLSTMRPCSQIAEHWFPRAALLDAFRKTPASSFGSQIVNIEIVRPAA
jgi:hypothetical protein